MKIGNQNNMKHETIHDNALPKKKKKIHLFHNHHLFNKNLWYNIIEMITHHEDLHTLFQAMPSLFNSPVLHQIHTRSIRFHRQLNYFLQNEFVAYKEYNIARYLYVMKNDIDAKNDLLLDAQTEEYEFLHAEEAKNSLPRQA